MSSTTALSGSLFDAAPADSLRLDPGFRPLALGARAYREALAQSTSSEPVAIAMMGAPGNVGRLDLQVFGPDAGRGADNQRYVAWMLRALLWVQGGHRVLIGGPAALCEQVAAEYRADGPYAWDADMLGKAFGEPFTIEVIDLADVPPASARPLSLGGHLDGYRIGFDLGASDYKVAAVVEGEMIFSTELHWEPKTNADPEYHFEKIQEGLRLAASHLPRVDAIGGSSAGILIDNQVMVASLFRAVPAELYEAKVRPIFNRVRESWGVPLEVINDGDVTALAGGLSLGSTALLGIALGSSEAVGYLDRDGRITGWLNELAFCPVDANPDAGRDDWAGTPGIGAVYFSQQAVGKLVGPAGLGFPAELPLPELLKQVQALAEQGDAAALEIFRTIGVYLGYTLPWYAEFYDLSSAMILGRVTSGVGGELILSTAKEILASEFAELADRLKIFLPDERARRVGQAVAAASLPATS